MKAQRSKNKALHFPELRSGVYALSIGNQTTTEPHTHNCLQIIYVIKGCVKVVNRDGVWVIPPNRAVWISPMEVHHLETSRAADIRNIYLKSTFAKLIPAASCFVFNLTPLVRELLDHIFSFGSIEDLPPAEFKILPFIIYQININKVSSVSFYIPCPRDHRLEKLCHLILENLSNKVSLSSLCKDSGLSFRNAQRIFKKETKITLSTWLSSHRIVKSINLILSGQSITTASLEVGFDTVSSYSRAFKRLMGHSPRVFISGNLKSKK